MMCRCLKVSRSGCYAWLGREPSRTVRRRKELSALIEWVFNSSRGTYGYRRTHAAGARRGVETSPDTVRSIMRSQGLEAAQPRRKVRTTVPAADLGSRPDLVRRDSRRQQAGSEVGGRYHLYPHLGGVRVPGDRPRLLHEESSRVRDGGQHAHRSDMRGDRYGGPQVPVHKRRDGIPLGPGVPVHLRPARQAPGELRHSPFGGQDRGVLGQCLGGSRRVRPSRNERVYQMVYPTRSKAIRDIASWIELEYNQKRLHSALGYRTPNEVEEEHRAVRQAA